MVTGLRRPVSIVVQRERINPIMALSSFASQAVHRGGCFACTGWTA
jgi:hypothetical protein